MSNLIRYDSLLVHYLAVELAGRLAGRRLEALRVDPGERRAALELSGSTLIWDLHPTRGWLWLDARPTAGTGVAARPGVARASTAAVRRIRLTRQTSIQAVRTPADERWLSFELTARRRSPGQVLRLVVELMGNQWNLLALDGADRIVAALWRRDAGGRTLRPGAPYQPPPPGERLGADTALSRDEWRALLGSVSPAERRRRLIARVAYTSPLNAAALLGKAAVSDDRASLDAAHARYAVLAALPPADPCVLELGEREQPYPLRLPGVSAQPAPTLLDAMAAASGAAPSTGTDTAGRPEDTPAGGLAGTPRVAPELIERLQERLRRTRARADRLRDELEGARPEAAGLRRSADLLLSQLQRVQKGMRSIELVDFAGGSIEVALDPALGPAENATRLYQAAKKRERAADRLPPLIRRAEEEARRLVRLLADAQAGGADAARIEAALGVEPAGRGPRSGDTEALPPYRRYRTSGGLEVRVGRNRRANDELTFHRSSPDDVWLHARDVAGSHVILRWAEAGANPPARDLHEAAVLAALHSRARTSGIVAVDWTRRKHVRKPRKAPPGSVIPERVETVFVEPDPAVERRLRLETG